MAQLRDLIRDLAVRRFIEPARQRGDQQVSIVAGDLVRELKLENRTPSVCHVLVSEAFQRENGLVLQGKEGPPSGLSTTMKYTYCLVDTGYEAKSAFLSSRGIAREVFSALGGGEAFLNREREGFGGP